jgi:hypothetical protein
MLQFNSPTTSFMSETSTGTQSTFTCQTCRVQYREKKNKIRKTTPLHCRTAAYQSSEAKKKIPRNPQQIYDIASGLVFRLLARASLPSSWRLLRCSTSSSSPTQTVSAPVGFDLNFSHLVRGLFVPGGNLTPSPSPATRPTRS